MSLIVVIVCLAVVVAFGALWLSSVALKKTETQLTAFADIVRRDFGGLKTDVDAKLAAIEVKMAKVEQKVEQSKDVEATARQLINDVNRDVAVLRDTVTELETSIPPQFRRRRHMSQQDQVQN